MYQGIRAVYNMVLSFQSYVILQQVSLDVSCDPAIECLHFDNVAGFHDGVVEIDNHT